ncbi:hypothetical protein [Halorussus amylolyticus]|uniref:hypothetical protein n=1 Tax=Halorussus amylolyticus TaxID=1126242 RepID=UPI00104BE5B8|nr:hypothetical protein [Halorussus amylolyticus]
MSVTGLCQICEQKEAKHSCPNCGTLACDEHWDEGLDLCAQCASTVERGGTDEGGVRPDDLDDDDVMRF